MVSTRMSGVIMPKVFDYANNPTPSMTGEEYRHCRRFQCKMIGLAYEHAASNMHYNANSGAEWFCPIMRRHYATFANSFKAVLSQRSMFMSPMF